MHYLALILVSAVTLSSTVLAVKQGWLAGETNNGNEQILSSTSQLEPTESAFAELKKPLYFAPVEIKIGQSQIKIEEIGLQTDGTLDTPTTWESAGWYSRSAKPGETGNIIIDGHYDTNQGTPAAFWDLKTLSANDTVLIKDETGRTFSYRIVDSFFVELTDPDRTRIFDEGSQDKSELTLVTCGGVWDSSKGTYSQRLVVKAELI